MSGRYDDIIHLPHHVSPTRRRMTPVERGAQFSPFAALVGFDAAVRETGRLTQSRIYLGEDSYQLINDRLRLLWEEGRPHTVTVTWFCPDEYKSGGEYVTKTGRVRKIDPVQQSLVLEDGTEIFMEEIIALEGSVFKEK